MDADALKSCWTDAPCKMQAFLMRVDGRGCVEELRACSVQEVCVSDERRWTRRRSAEIQWMPKRKPPTRGRVDAGACASASHVGASGTRAHLHCSAGLQVPHITSKDLLRWRWLCASGIYHSAGNTISSAALKAAIPLGLIAEEIVCKVHNDVWTSKTSYFGRCAAGLGMDDVQVCSNAAAPKSTLHTEPNTQNQTHRTKHTEPNLRARDSG